MITATKRFGSYVLERATDAIKHYESDIGTDDYESSCTIPNAWVELELLEIRPYNDDTSIFRFQLPDSQQYLRLPLGSFLLVKAPDCEHGGGDAIRPYTSISIDGNGYFEIICKRYNEWGIKEEALKSQAHFLFIKTDHSYRPAGAVSNYIHNLKVGNACNLIILVGFLIVPHGLHRLLVKNALALHSPPHSTVLPHSIPPRHTQHCSIVSSSIIFILSLIISFSTFQTSNPRLP